jgi:hypothetical protein
MVGMGRDTKLTLSPALGKSLPSVSHRHRQFMAGELNKRVLRRANLGKAARMKPLPPSPIFMAGRREIRHGCGQCWHSGALYGWHNQSTSGQFPYPAPLFMVSPARAGSKTGLSARNCGDMGHRQFFVGRKRPAKALKCWGSYGKVVALDTTIVNRPDGFLSAHTFSGVRSKSRIPACTAGDAKVKSRAPDQFVGLLKSAQPVVTVMTQGRRVL